MSIITNIRELKKLDDILTQWNHKRRATLPIGAIYACDIKDIVDACEPGLVKDVFTLLWEHLSADESSFQ